MSPVRIHGAGPAGGAAAIACLRMGRAVQVYEKSAFPRHRVCGEFLSPECAGMLERLGVWRQCTEAMPAPIRRLVLHLGRRVKQCSLPETAWGLSRYRLDALLLEEAVRLGAVVTKQLAPPPAPVAICATGRNGRGSRGERLFGFKAHFRGGAADDSVSLYFRDRCYVGVSQVEGGLTNICGLAPEASLRPLDFQFDALLEAWPPLAERVAGIERTMRWHVTGPLRFHAGFLGEAREGIYPAGDCAGFVDPFTGSGILSALACGYLAGRAAARGEASADYLANCRAVLRAPYRVAGLFRAALRTGLASWFSMLAPADWLFAWTRPRLSRIDF